MSKIRVLIVDDSELSREAIRVILESEQNIEIIAEAHNGLEGFDMALALKPDVITMDLQMPVMDGLESIEKIMENNPTPIILVSTANEDQVEKALSAGAMEIVFVRETISEMADALLAKVQKAYDLSKK